MSKRICAQSTSQPEFTLCGDAFDAFESGDAEEEHEHAEQGGTITCPACCRQIQDIRSMRYRLKPRGNFNHDQ